MRVHRERERERESKREKKKTRERKRKKERETEHCSRATAERLGVLTMDIHSPRANTWTLEQHPAFDRFTNQPTTFAVRPRHQPRSSSLSIILYPLNVNGNASFSHTFLGDRRESSPIGIRATSRRHSSSTARIIVSLRKTVALARCISII